MNIAQASRAIPRALLPAALAAVFCAAGCGGNIAEKEAAERATALYKKAEDAYKSGRLDDAVSGFENAIRSDPSCVSAHFQLAVLLQDHKRDYIGAIAHYREYVALRPDADKSPVAEGRIARCTQLLANELAPGAGVQPSAAKTEIEKRNADLYRRTYKENASLKSENAALRQKLAERETRIAELSAELEGKLSGGADAPAPLPHIPTEKELIESVPVDASPSPIDGAAAVRAEAEKADDEAAALAASLEEARAMVRAVEGEDAAPAAAHPQPSPGAHQSSAAVEQPPASPPRPATYTVQPGDSLMKISEKLYGTKSRWKDIYQANKEKVSQSGDDIKAGTVLKIP